MTTQKKRDMTDTQNNSQTRAMRLYMPYGGRRRVAELCHCSIMTVDRALRAAMLSGCKAERYAMIRRVAIENGAYIRTAAGYMTCKDIQQ